MINRKNIKYSTHPFSLQRNDRKRHFFFISWNNFRMTRVNVKLTHCGLVTPYGDIDLGQHWLRKWLVAWRHQAINWTNVGWSSVKSSDIHVRAISQEMPQPSITKTHLKIIYKISFKFPRGQWVKLLADQCGCGTGNHNFKIFSSDQNTWHYLLKFHSIFPQSNLTTLCVKVTRNW